METDGRWPSPGLTWPNPPRSPRPRRLDIGRAPQHLLLVRDVQIEKPGPPFHAVRLTSASARIVKGPGRTVVELNAIQRGQSGYTVDAATQAELDARAKSDIRLNRIDTAAGAESLAVRASLTGPAVTQVFALENPPRLVVDIFDTLLAAKSDVWPIDDPRSTVQRVRVAQFQSSGPRPITRMVFDLKEPGLYAMDSRSDGLVVSFFPSVAAAPATFVQPAPPAAPAPLPAPAKSEPAGRQQPPRRSPSKPSARPPPPARPPLRPKRSRPRAEPSRASSSPRRSSGTRRSTPATSSA
jgi:type IV pilus assembly protein PilQ